MNEDKFIDEFTLDEIEVAQEVAFPRIVRGSAGSEVIGRVNLDGDVEVTGLDVERDAGQVAVGFACDR